ncbi:MAG: FIG074102: hypothetical protein, partial [uncultured Ramlibacter sp.]
DHRDPCRRQRHRARQRVLRRQMREPQPHLARWNEEVGGRGPAGHPDLQHRRRRGHGVRRRRVRVQAGGHGSLAEVRRGAEVLGAGQLQLRDPGGRGLPLHLPLRL